MKAMILFLLGTTFEVRLINCRTGKDIPGRCMYKGGYWKARKVYKKINVKYGYTLRLQAVTLMKHRLNSTEPVSLEDAQDHQNQIARQRLDNVSEKRLYGEAGYGIAESNARQSEFMAEHQDEPNAYGGEDPDDHVCDLDGPQDWDDERGVYRPTCSTCGTFNV